MLLGTFIVALFMVAWDELKNQHRVPIPSKFIYVAIIWGVLGVIAEMRVGEIGTTKALASGFAVAFTVAMAYRYFAKHEPWPSDLPYGPGEGPQYPGPM